MSWFENVKNALASNTTSTAAVSESVKHNLTTDPEEKKRTATGVFRDYFEPEAGKLRVRDVVREMYGIGDAESNIVSTFKSIGNFGKSILQETARSGGSVGLTINNTKNRAVAAVTGKQARITDQMDLNRNATAFEKNLQRILFGDEPLESIGYRIDKAPTRATAFAREMGFDNQNIVNGWTAPVLVPAMIALDFTGAGKSDDVFKVISKSDKASDIFKLLKTNFKNIPKGQEYKLAKQLVGVTDERKVKVVMENAMRAAEMRKLERMAQPVVTKTVNKGMGTAMDIGKKVDTSVTKTRKFAQTIEKSDLVDPKVTAAMAKNYNPLRNETVATEARKFIATDDKAALAYLRDSTEDYSTFTNAVGQMMIRRLNDAGRYDEAVEIADIMTDKAVAAGRAVQSFSMWNRLSPEGILLKASKIDKEVVKQGGKSRLTPDKVKKLTDLARNIEKLDDGPKKAEETGKLLNELYSIAPPSIGARIASIQTMAQLLNPKTFMRNVIGNGGFSVIENVKDVPAAALDSAVSLITKKRTKTLPSFNAQIRGIGQGAKDGWRDALLGIDTSGVPNRFELPQTPVFKNVKVMESAEKLLNISLRVPDRAMYKAAYDGSLYQQMKAYTKATGKVLDGPTDDMLEIAHHEGLYRTFQDDNMLTFMFSGLKRALNGGKDFGLGDIILKYPKTPANLLNRGIAYSPAGFVQSVFEMSKPLMGQAFDQRKFVESLSRASVGSTGMVGTGAILNQLGILGTSLNEDYDIANVERESGLANYQFNVSALKRFVLSGFDADAIGGLQEGDTLYTVDWFQPVIFPIVFGANVNSDLTGPEAATETFTSALAAAIDSVGEQSLIKNFTQAFKQGSISGVALQAARQVPASFIPTLVNQAKQLMDNSRRQIYNPNDLVYAKNLAYNRVPGLADTIQPQISAFGNEMETYQNGSNNLFNVLFNPGFQTVYEPSDEAKLVLELYNQTGETSQAPRLKSFKTTINGKETTLGPKSMRMLQQTVGTMTRLEFHALANDPNFLALPPEEQVKYMEKQLTAIGGAAKHWVLGDNKEAYQKSGYSAAEKMFLTKLYSGVYGDTTGLDLEGYGEKIISEQQQNANQQTN